MSYISDRLSWNGVRVSGLMPYTWFVRIPGLASFREADRLAILGLVPAALLAGAAVNWLRYHAKPLLAVVLVLGILEAGFSGTGKVRSIPTSYPNVDAGIAADHSPSIVVDVPFGLRGGIPVYGSPFFAKALVMATADGHPRAIAYTSRAPDYTLQTIEGHPFYRYLNLMQHQRPMVCPWALPAPGTLRPGHQEEATGCPLTVGVAPLHPLKLSPAQVAAAVSALTELGIDDVAVCGLAKRLEEVWLPGEDAPVILPRSSEGLYLLQRVRDEAHRFAITYHRAKRSKALAVSQLDEIPGLGPARRTTLLRHFGSVRRIAAATPEELALVPGIGPQLADAVLAALRPERESAPEREGAPERDGAPERESAEATGKGTP